MAEALTSVKRMRPGAQRGKNWIDAVVAPGPEPEGSEASSKPLPMYTWYGVA